AAIWSPVWSIIAATETAGVNHSTAITPSQRAPPARNQKRKSPRAAKSDWKSSLRPSPQPRQAPIVGSSRRARRAKSCKREKNAKIRKATIATARRKRSEDAVPGGVSSKSLQPRAVIPPSQAARMTRTAGRKIAKHLRLCQKLREEPARNSPSETLPPRASA